MSLRRIAYRYSARIETHTEILKPFGKICGQVILSNNVPLRNQGMYIQFEGLCIFHNSSKRIRKKGLSPETRIFIAGYTKHHPEAKDCVPGIKESFWFEVPCILNPGTLTLPFTLEIPGDRDLPSEFVTPFGSLKYRLSVNIHTAFEGSVKIGQRPLHFSGYSNLLLNPLSSLPIQIEQVYKNSLFQKRPLLEVVFSMEKSGFLTGEEMGFAMSVTNRKCVPLTMSVSLVSTVRAPVHNGQENMRVCETKETSGINREPDYNWVGSIPIRYHLAPSFHAENAYSLVYSVQFKVNILDHGEISGEALIHIGTTKQSLRVLKAVANSDSLETGCSCGERLMPLPLNLVDAEMPPPLYSTLLTRANSKETPPPSYEDVISRDNSFLLDFCN